MREEKILINNLEVNYKVAGDREPFLILHGWGSSSEKWEKVGELLIEKGFKVIIPDLPGFGKNQKLLSVPWSLDDYCNFVEIFTKLLKLDKFYLLGHSFGGAIATRYASKYPHKIEKLFLVAPSIIRKKTFKKEILKKLSIFFPKSPFLRKVFYRVLFIKSDYPYTQGIMKETYLRVIKEGLLNDAANISVPTMIIWGKKDEALPLKQAYLIKEKVKNSKLIIISEAGHDLEQKVPEILAEKILNFIEL